MIHRLAIAFLCNVTVVLLLGPSVPVFAQELPGKVIDENSQIVAGAQVSLSGAIPGSSLSAVSDDAGRFVIPAVPPGIYDLRAEKPGYYATVVKGLNIGKRAEDRSREFGCSHEDYACHVVLFPGLYHRFCVD
jgi:hypothetical protein